MTHRISAYLDTHLIPYRVIEHVESQSSLGSAYLSQIPLPQLAKAVMLEDHESKRLMAVLPANYKISLSSLNDALKRRFHLMKERQVYRLFADCSPGAVPPIAEAYHLDIVYDDLLLNQPHVYIESGDHRHLLQLAQADFRQLMEDAKHLRFSHETFH
ncbi:aminoacyl-tRNA deacylase [Pseudoalteromonas rubra]|uniref:YbaK/aminoacyl-tRNA synthetase-associated domain-containing protein n=1 Tax=Pseudoalteromonas rubra TaxID=43658 RepID=A0A4Q7ENC3_9GAMM|nr:YbaK/EbsC family protein [Pseudoalteromonas rubra]RZM84954.1 hypothetical protein C3B51_02165 [Pseudoalteromonas rubra]